MAQTGAAGCHQNPNFKSLLEQLADEWKEPVSNVLGSVTLMWEKMRNYNDLIKHLNELEELIKSSRPAAAEAQKVLSFVEKLSNLKTTVLESLRSLCSVDAQSCNDVDYEAIWKKVTDEVLEKVSLEKIEAANECVRCQLITSAFILVVECLVIYATFEDIRSADNLAKQCKDVDIPNIKTKIDEIQKKEAQLRSKIEQCMVNGTTELKLSLIDQSAALSRKLTKVGNLIAEVGFDIRGKIVQIGAVKRDQILRGCTNGAQALGNGVQLAYLFENLSNKYKWVQGLITASYGIAALVNVRNSFVCEKKLKQLRALQSQIHELAALVDRVHEEIENARKVLTSKTD